MISTQPRTGGVGGFLGFDYGPLDSMLDARFIPMSERIFILYKLNVITNVAVRYWNKKPEG